MKYITFIFILFVLTTSCGSKKESITTKPITTTVIEKKVDTVKTEINTKDIKNTEVIAETNKTIAENKTSEIVDTKTTEAFNHFIFNDLLQKHVSINGNVNYNGFKKDKTTLKNYISLLSQSMPNNSWTKEDQLAYWINAYNALTIDLILRNHPLKSIKDIKKPWDQRLWKFGEKWINLNDIEHQILRKMNEPRIHFAIVCASFSCPKLQNKAFIATDLETQLTKVTTDFLQDKNRNVISANSLKLSKIFKWFSKDFKTEGSIINFINQYLENKVNTTANISYLDYNWSLNN